MSRTVTRSDSNQPSTATQDGRVDDQRPTPPLAIDSFSGEYRWLSNFWPVPDGVNGYPTVEHAYQASKTLDLNLRDHIATLPTAGAAKREGRRIEVRPDWERIKLTVMFRLLRRKFWPTSVLGNQLLGTGSAVLIEGNTWGDTYWGVCNGEGHNHLGQLLMMVRAELREALVIDRMPWAPKNGEAA